MAPIVKQMLGETSLMTPGGTSLMKPALGSALHPLFYPRLDLKAFLHTTPRCV
jgi:hypothetical protein